MAIPRHYSSALTLQELNDVCNQDENNLNAQLQSLKAGHNQNGEKVTEGQYEPQDGFDNLGNLVFTANSGSDSAWIMTVETTVKISRS